MPMGRRNRDNEETLRCPSCGELVRLDSLRPTFKSEYAKPDGKLDVPIGMLMHGGWLNKIMEGVVCPKCGEKIGEPSSSGHRAGRR